MKEFLIICMGFSGCIFGVGKKEYHPVPHYFVSKHVRRWRKGIDTQIRCLNTNKLLKSFSGFVTEFHAISADSA